MKESNTPKEIDPIALINALISGRWLILLTSLIFATGAALYSTQMDESYSIKANVKPNNNITLIDWIYFVQQYQPIFDRSNVKGEPENNELIKFSRPYHLYVRFLNAYNDRKNKMDFFEENYLIFDEENDKSNEASEKNRDLIASHSITELKANPITKHLMGPQELTFKSSSSVVGSKVLKAYISFVNTRVIEELQADFATLLSTRGLQLVKERELMLAEAHNLLEIEKQRTQFALALSRNAQVMEPMTLSKGDAVFGELLGVNLLSEKAKILNKFKDYQLFEPEIAKLDLLINEVDKYKRFDGGEFDLYDNEKNHLTISSNKTAMSLLIVLGVLVGFILSVLFVVFRFILRSNVNPLYESSSV
ncbi:Wzz/FepE/Etk N-terminal domain-containing protein [Vibrio sp. 1CM23M]|uniref:Wzz/FepE/Etk N-terminal domain-containing protein n=1 Tax=Vibrio sp. 1CM23M TaxID=2929164 RepID=UPI0020C0AD0D|nr:Wzz/FepE/Etk N-terminal domain-containing protein [Vibrio sp. 1CM23M]MCK8073703.1 Wzz/FepE/Etk N-terminal domain-containing protein [Vibrio sp. 1CM23M]